MNVVLFGGCGFLGAHFARHLLESDSNTHVLLCDMVPLDKGRFSASLLSVLDSTRCSFKILDVRQKIPPDLVSGKVGLIANFAAVHREPGHEHHEYWESNVLGAEHVTQYAREVSCTKILFTSSISPYGASCETRDETSIPTPTSPYGGSKFVAEKIHQIWQAEADDRELLIVRPGVIFGAGESGNVTRMVKFLQKGLFLYLGNKDVRKAGVFVKELCWMCDWGLTRLNDPNFCNIRLGAAVFNASFDPPPSVAEYVEAIVDVGNFRRAVPTLPYWILYLGSFFAFGLGGIHPVRMRKLKRPNLILPKFLMDKGYPWKWSLKGAFEDWKKDMPEDWN